MSLPLGEGGEGPKIRIDLARRLRLVNDFIHPKNKNPGEPCSLSGFLILDLEASFLGAANTIPGRRADKHPVAGRCIRRTRLRDSFVEVISRIQSCPDSKGELLRKGRRQNQNPTRKNSDPRIKSFAHKV